MVASMVVKGSRRGFNSLVVLIAWLLWWERNDRVFNGVHKLAHQLAQHVGLQWIIAGFSSLSDRLQ
jgi:hypothetical protein